MSGTRSRNEITHFTSSKYSFQSDLEFEGVVFEEESGCWYHFFGAGLKVTKAKADEICRSQNARLPIMTTTEEAFGLKNRIGE